MKNLFKKLFVIAMLLVLITPSTKADAYYRHRRHYKRIHHTRHYSYVKRSYIKKSKKPAKLKTQPAKEVPKAKPVKDPFIENFKDKTVLSGQIKVIIDMTKYKKPNIYKVINKNEPITLPEYIGYDFSGNVSLSPSLSNPISLSTYKPIKNVIIYPIMISWLDKGLTPKEKALAKAINNFRVAHNLRPLPISRTLTYVARAHLKEAEINNTFTIDSMLRPDRPSLHSWDKSFDPTVNYSYKVVDHYDPQTSWFKPKELLNSPESGYEIAIWNSQEITPEKAVDGWHNSPEHNAVMSSIGEWATLTNYMGVAIDHNIAYAWFSKTNPNETTFSY